MIGCTEEPTILLELLHFLTKDGDVVKQEQLLLELTRNQHAGEMMTGTNWPVRETNINLYNTLQELLQFLKIYHDCFGFPCYSPDLCNTYCQGNSIQPKQERLNNVSQLTPTFYCWLVLLKGKTIVNTYIYECRTEQFRVYEKAWDGVKRAVWLCFHLTDLK
jgi:hypothetical protein